ncbi:ABC transporter [Gordonibacter urolithinfaciens]|jgi:ABC-2 type transport system permease protein|uniref:ABC transporter permease n=1 Tax=Gordonibacter urolithinfaciens TaxID=1335613 RepID=UPI000B369FE5|nr:ABC transporter permease [Gordonibacter urolithinfaciens]OUO87440.1 ABC transporter [Gordonibacter urolithinfaciens]
MTSSIATSDTKRNVFVLTSLVTKDFKLKYRRSVLGVLWSILNPLLMMVVLSVVFSFMFRFNIPNYPMYLILGTILFNFMVGATNGAMTSIIQASSLIKKIRVEKLVFPLEKVIFELVNFAISLVAVAIVMIFTQVPLTFNALFLPLLLIYMLLFCAGVGMILSSLAVYFRDVIHLWGVVCTAWTYATPIFYPMDMLSPTMQEAMLFNPMYHYITYFRDIMMWNINPGMMENAICFGMAAFTFVIGLLVFRKSEKRFILYV